MLKDLGKVNTKQILLVEERAQFPEFKKGGILYQSEPGWYISDFKLNANIQGEGAVRGPLLTVDPDVLSEDVIEGFVGQLLSDVAGHDKGNDYTQQITAFRDYLLDTRIRILSGKGFVQKIETEWRLGDNQPEETPSQLSVVLDVTLIRFLTQLEFLQVVTDLGGQISQGSDLTIPKWSQFQDLSIVELLTSRGHFSTLLAALDATGLVDALGGPGPFTLFAPTDNAFASSIPTPVMQQLLSDPSGQLTELLLHHLVAAHVTLADITSTSEVLTLQGNSILVKNVAGRTTVADAGILAVDIPATNGIVHIIDAVLQPFTPTPPLPGR